MKTSENASKKNKHPCHQFSFLNNQIEKDTTIKHLKEIHTAHLVEFPIPWTSKDMIRISVLILHSFSSPFLANMVPCGFGY